MISESIYVESEFAPLRTVILAESEFGFPSAPLSADESAFLPPESKQLFDCARGGDFSDLFPDKYASWLKERENLVSVLKKYDVKIHKPRKLTEAEKAVCGDKGYSNFFVRDPIFTVGSFVIEGSMRFLHRRHEVLPVRTVVHEHIMPATCSYIAVPQPEIHQPGDTTMGIGPYLEGGDILVLGKHVFVGSSGLASNKMGYHWLKKLLSPCGYHVEYVPLKPSILHLDCALSLVNEGLMIVCESAFMNGIPDILKPWTKINITETDCARLAANGLPINESTYVIDPVFSDIGDALIKEGIVVECVDFSVSRAFGGSFRCSTQPLLRK
jgi:glycine amidinotransferase